MNSRLLRQAFAFVAAAVVAGGVAQATAVEAAGRQHVQSARSAQARVLLQQVTAGTEPPTDLGTGPFASAPGNIAALDIAGE